MKKLTDSWKQQKPLPSRLRNADKKCQQPVLEQGVAASKAQRKKAPSQKVELSHTGSSYSVVSKHAPHHIKRNRTVDSIPAEANDRRIIKPVPEPSRSETPDMLPGSRDSFWQLSRFQEDSEINEGSEHQSKIGCMENSEKCSNTFFESMKGDVLAEIEKAENEYLSKKTSLSNNTNAEESAPIRYTQLKTKNSQDLAPQYERIAPKRGIKQIPQNKSVWNSSIQNYSIACSNKRLLSSWNLPTSVVEQYKKLGVSEMFQWQVDCLLMGKVLDGGNLVYSAPTSAGKTMIAEILILKKILERKRKALMILPFISVAREKVLHLQKIFSEVGVRVDGYMGCHSPPGGFKTIDLAICTIEKANGLVNRLLEDRKLHQIGIIVVDELHMLGDSHRGYLLELLLTKVLYMSKKNCNKQETQIVGMSATLPNLDTLAHWLQADLYTTDFRPVPLRELIKIGPVIYDSDTLSEVRCLKDLSVSFQNDSDHSVYLCIETVTMGHSVLVFCPTKAWCEKLAESIAREVYRLGKESMEGSICMGIVLVTKEMGGRLREELNANDLADVLELLKRCPAGLDSTLGCTIRFGVAYHHAGLTFDERDIIENAFRSGVIRILIATSTLSSGVNLPARRVIIRSPTFRGSVIDVLTYKQMVGRAGRKGVDTEGESILLCKENEQARAISLVKSALTPVQSCLVQKGDNTLTNSVKRAILEVIASCVASTPEEVLLFASSTLLAASQEDCEVNSIIEKALLFLQHNEFIYLQQNENDGKTQYKPTKFGKAVLSSSMSPNESLRILEELQQARKYFVLDNDLHLLYQIIPPYLSDSVEIQDWIRFLTLWEQLSDDMKRVGELIGVEDRFITKAVRGQINSAVPKQARSLAIHQRFYVALALNELIHEVSLREVSTKYNCPRGMLQSLQQSAATFAGMVTVFCSHLGWHNLELLITQFQRRLYFGVQHDLCDLMRLSSLNAQRARTLHNGGYETVSSVAASDVNQIELLLKNSLPFQSAKKEEEETDFDLKKRCQARSVWITGQKGLTEKEAAYIIIKEARDIVQFDLGIQINWHQSSSQSATSTDASFCNSNLKTTVPSTSISQEGNKNADFENKSIIHNKNIFIPGVGDSPAVTQMESQKYASSLQSCFKSASEHISSSVLNSKSRFHHSAVSSSNNDKALPVANKEKSTINWENHDVRKAMKLGNNLPQNNSVLKSNHAESAPSLYSDAFNVGETCMTHSRLDNPNTFDDKNCATLSNLCINKESFEYSKSSGDKNVSGKQPKLNAEILRNFNDHDSISFCDEKQRNLMERNNFLDKSPSLLPNEALTKDYYLRSGKGKPNDAETFLNTEVKTLHLIKENADVKWYSNSTSFELSFSDKNSNSGDNETGLSSSGSVFNMDSVDTSRNDLVGVSNEYQHEKNSVQAVVNSPRNPKTHTVPSQEISPTLLNVAGMLSPWAENSTLISDMYRSGLTSTPCTKVISGPKQSKRSMPDATVKTRKKSKSSSNSSNQHSSFSDCVSPTPPKSSTITKQGSSSLCNFDNVNNIKPTQGMTNINGNNVLKSNNNSLDLSYDQFNSLSVPNKVIGKTTIFKAGRSFSITDVSCSLSVFKKFLLEWEEKAEFSFSVACERQAHYSPPGNKIGLKRQRESRVTTLKSDILSKGVPFGVRDIIVGLSVCWSNSGVFYISFAETNINGFNMHLKLEKVKQVLQKSDIQRIGIAFDIKEQYNVLCSGCGILLDCTGNTAWQDPKVADWLLDQNSNEKSLYKMVSDYLPGDKVMLDAVGKCPGMGSLGLSSLSKGNGKERSAVEALLTFGLMDKLWKKLIAYSLEKAFTEVEMPALLILAKMEQNGLGLDVSQTEQLQCVLQENLQFLSHEAYRLAKRPFSLNSPDEIAKILFKELKLVCSSRMDSKERICRRASSFPSTAKQSLLKLKSVHPLPSIILEWRKLHSALYKVLYPFIKKKTFNASLQMMRIYGRYDIFTSTGRVNMYEPNLQTVPRDFKLEHRNAEDNSIERQSNSYIINMRSAFIPFQGAVFLAADYSQLEIRILAHLSKDKKLIELLNGGGDIFKTIASQWKGGKPEDICDLDRQHAKQICYGMIYGIGIKTLSDQLDVEEEEASVFMERFKATYPGVRRYLDFVVKNCRKEGYIETLHGRRRYLPSINSPAYSIRAKAERQAVNATIQGSAADLVKMAMIKINQELEDLYPETYPHRCKIVESSRQATSRKKSHVAKTLQNGAYLVLELHDELIYEVPEDDLPSVADIVKNNMENAVSLSVDLPIKIKVGSSWGNMTNWIKTTQH